MRVRCLIAVVALSWAVSAHAARLEALPDAGGIRVHVEKRGLFSAFAHDHDFEVTRWHGTAEVPGDDPAHATLELVLEAGSLRDREEGLSSGDRGKVEAQTAGSKVLDAAHAPEIVYRSDRGSVDLGSGADATPVKGTIHGQLTLRGKSRPVDAHFEATRQGEGWSVSGKARFRQSDFGIEPFNGAGGTVGVKDEVEVVFKLLLRPGTSERGADPGSSKAGAGGK
jgi:polyisoprenoid-binding protein YceI